MVCDVALRPLLLSCPTGARCRREPRARLVNEKSGIAAVFCINTGRERGRERGREGETRQHWSLRLCYSVNNVSWRWSGQEALNWSLLHFGDCGSNLSSTWLSTSPSCQPWLGVSLHSSSVTVSVENMAVQDRWSFIRHYCYKYKLGIR